MTDTIDPDDYLEALASNREELAELYAAPPPPPLGTTTPPDVVEAVETVDEVPLEVGRRRMMTPEEQAAGIEHVQRLRELLEARNG